MQDVTMPGLVLSVVAVIAAIWWLVPKAVDSAQMGHVSERWLAEYRASHPSWTSNDANR